MFEVVYKIQRQLQLIFASVLALSPLTARKHTRCDVYTQNDTAHISPQTSLLQKKRKKLNIIEREAQIGLCSTCLTFIFEHCCGCVVLDTTGINGKIPVDRLAVKATVPSGLCLGRSEALRSFRHCLQAQSQGHHAIDRLAERGIERDVS